MALEETLSARWTLRFLVLSPPPKGRAAVSFSQWFEVSVAQFSGGVRSWPVLYLYSFTQERRRCQATECGFIVLQVTHDAMGSDTDAGLEGGTGPIPSQAHKNTPVISRLRDCAP